MVLHTSSNNNIIRKMRVSAFFSLSFADLWVFWQIDCLECLRTIKKEG